MVTNLERYLLLFSLTASCSVLEGPGDNARIIPHSERIAAQDLPLEHRGGGGSGLLLPDVFSVSRNLTSQLKVDLFFSLFFVFLNNQFEESHQTFTIFAPAGLPTQEAAKWLSAKEQLTEELLLNHIVLGEHLRPEMITRNVVRSTLGGLEVSFNIDEAGELWVNNVKIVAWKTEGRALIIAMEDYLFKQEVEEEVKNLTEVEDVEEEEWPTDPEVEVVEAGEFIPTPRNQEKNCTLVKNKSGLGIFKSITVCTENVSMVKMTEEPRAPAVRKIDGELPLLELVEQELTFLRGGPGINYFLTFANQTNLQSKLLANKQTFTLLAPLDEAFQTWHPIDWGFNPFAVDSFLEELMENLVITEAVDINEVGDKLDGGEFLTLGGESVKITTKGENIYINGVLVLGDLRLAGSQSQVILLDQVPWLDLALVEQLRSNYSHLETGPPTFNGTLEPPEDEDSLDTTTITADDEEEDEEKETSSVYDPVNFPTTTISPSELDTTDLSQPFLSVKTSFDEDHIRFPPNTTAEKNEVEPVSVEFYNKTSDNNASLIVFKLKQLLHSETELPLAGESQPRQTRIVYINNKRVELESELESEPGN